MSWSSRANEPQGACHGPADPALEASPCRCAQRHQAQGKPHEALEYVRRLEAVQALLHAAPADEDPSALEALSREIDSWAPSLGDAFAGQEELVQALRQLLNLEISSQRTLLQKPPRGKPPANDFAADLLNTLKVLGVEFQVLRGLRALEGTDPWIDQKLLPKLQEDRASVEDLRKYVEKVLAQDPRTPGLLQQSGELLRQLQEALGDIPQELRGPGP